MTVPVIEVSARMLFHRGDRVLLAQNRGARSFFLPGGPVARGERVEAMLRREVARQTGITPGALDFVGCVESMRAARGTTFYAMLLVFAAAQPYGVTIASLVDGVHMMSLPARELPDVQLVPDGLGETLFDWLDERRPFWRGHGGVS